MAEIRSYISGAPSLTTLIGKRRLAPTPNDSFARPVSMRASGS